jgi:hypothetical protein
VNVAELVAGIGQWIGSLPAHTRVLLALATTVFVVELALRRLAPRSALYRRWTAAFQAVGKVWTAVILGIIYFVSVAAVSAVMKALGRDLLDRKVAPEATYWRNHEPNPLGPLAASRHQF